MFKIGTYTIYKFLTLSLKLQNKYNMLAIFDKILSSKMYTLKFIYENTINLFSNLCVCINFILLSIFFLQGDKQANHCEKHCLSDVFPVKCCPSACGNIFEFDCESVCPYDIICIFFSCSIYIYIYIKIQIDIACYRGLLYLYFLHPFALDYLCIIVNDNKTPDLCNQMYVGYRFSVSSSYLLNHGLYFFQE